MASLKARMLKPVMLGLGPWAIRSALLEAGLKGQSLSYIGEEAPQNAIAVPCSKHGAN